MSDNTDTKIALHEQRLNTLELAYPRFETKIDLILEKLSTTVVTKVEYEKDVKDQKAVNKVVENELETIKSTMVTKAQMDMYNRSQFWQKFLTAVGTALITALVVFEATKNL